MFKYKIHIFFFLLFINSTVFAQNRGFYDNNEFKKKRHEVNFGIGTSNCLTDIGGNYSVSGIGENNDTLASQIAFFKSIYDTDLSKSRPVFNAAYIYHFKNKINFRANLAFASVGGDDANSLDIGRKNRNLNFKSNILEVSAIAEFYILKPSTGNKFNLKDVKGHKLAPNILSTIGIYFIGGVGGFLFNPKSQNNFNYKKDSLLRRTVENEDFNPASTSKWTSLRNLHTEGQGSINHEEYIIANGLDTSGVKIFGQKRNGNPKTYSPIAICIPLGFGIEKAFNSDVGIKIEAGYRFTSTDYLDDVSGFYASRDDLAEIQNSLNGDALLAQTMSGTGSNEVSTHMFFAENRPEISPGLTVPAPRGGDWVTSDTDIYQGISGPYGPLAYKFNQTSYERGFVRGGAKSKDSYAFLNVSFYKKFSSHGKVYKNIHSKERRRIKASF